MFLQKSTMSWLGYWRFKTPVTFVLLFDPSLHWLQFMNVSGEIIVLHNVQFYFPATTCGKLNKGPLQIRIGFVRQRGNRGKPSYPWNKQTNRGPDHLAPLGHPGRFLVSTWDSQLKFSEFAWFGISWNLSKVESIQTTFIFIFLKEDFLKKPKRVM